MARKRVLYLFPTEWDLRQLEACRADWEGEYEVRFAEPSDVDAPDDLDVLGYIEDVVARERGRVDGVTSSSDYPGATVAAAVATELGLPGPRPEDVVRCSHKLLSRERQREAAPEAVPWFAGVRYDQAASTELEYPCFVKPVKGSFSQHTRRVDSHAELVRFLGRAPIADYCERYLAIFNQLVEHWTPFQRDGRWFIAEGLLTGPQVTVEGYTQHGEVTLLGVVDSVMHPGTNSFARFDLPSRHPPERVEAMRELAARVMRRMGLESAMFNMELVVDERDGRISILEINPRICGQFGDLYAKVHGTSGFRAQLDLAVGERPTFHRFAGPHGVAASVPLRTFERVRVARVPGEAELARLRELQPDTLVWLEASEGQLLDPEDPTEDGRSVRYAVVNLGARNPEDLTLRMTQDCLTLGIVLAPTARGPSCPDQGY